MTSVQDRVQAGMDFLDKHFPDHVKTFNPSEFDIMNRGGEDNERGFNRCALMQATGVDWSDAEALAGLQCLREAQDLGFFPVGRLSSIAGTTFHQDTYDLNAAWLTAYAQRQAA